MKIEKVTLSLFQSIVVAAEQLAVVVIEVQAGAFAVAPDFAVLALSFAGPRAVAHHLKTVLPHLPEIVLVYISLIHVTAHRGAAADAAVATDRSHLDATAAEEEVVAHLLLVLAEETFAGIADVEDCVIA